MLNSRIDRKLLNTRIKSRMDNKLLPGALGPTTLYKQLRVAGYEVTIDAAKSLRSAWIDAFPEMEYHMQAAKMSQTEIAKYSYIKPVAPVDGEEEGEEEEEEEDRFIYTSTTLTGRKRNRCSYNSSCNFKFQGLASDCLKRILYDLFRAGYGPFMNNEVHDEADGILPLTAVRTHVPNIERIVVHAAKQLLPDVRVTVETSLCKYWDKGGVVFDKLQYDEKGLPIIPVPQYIEELKLKKAC